MHCAGIVVRDLARRPSNWRSEESLDAYLRRHRVPGLAGIDTRRLTRHLRDHGALPGAFGTDEAAVRAAAADGPGHRRPRPRGHRHLHRAVPGPGQPPDAPFSVVAYDFGIKTSILRRLVGRRLPGRGRARRRPRPTTCWPAGPTACSCPTGPATRPAWSAPPTPSGASSARCRSSASASATSCSAWRSAAPPPSSPSGTTAPTTPSAGSAAARSRSPARTTTTPSTPTRSLRSGAEVTHVNLNDGVVEGLRGRAPAGLLGAVPPRGGPRPPRRRLPLRRLHRAHGGYAGKCRSAPTSSSILVIGSGPIVIGQACEFDYSGTQACRVLRARRATGSSSSTPTRPRS